MCVPIEQCTWQYQQTSRGVAVYPNHLGNADARPQGYPAHLPRQAKCSYCTLLVLLGAVTEDASELHPPFADVEPLCFLFPSSSTYCPLPLSRNGTCGFANDFWLPNAIVGVSP